MLEADQSPITQPTTIYLKDYLPPAFRIATVDMTFELSPSATIVTTKLKVERTNAKPAPLVLDGEKLVLRALTIDGQEVSAGSYSVTDTTLTINEVPDTFELQIVTELDPKSNTELSGLYQSSGNFCTQCEAEGFRRITYFLDRPDVLSVYSVRIIADQATCPVLLSNGNLLEQGQTENGKHWAQWHDPHPKPSYLFALVAGRLERISDSFITQSGNKVELNIYTEAHNIHLCDHAMASLKHSMRWDEEVYGREYDLDLYNIVAVDDFNMGAMENKGLNIFNSKYVLADQASATDTDYEGIEAVIGHEYFHNWSGNRVTCRDWFQLSLKEGFTVFRDQEFSADMGSRAVKRIRDVQVLRNHQFKEDAGPMAHPVRPSSYQEIDNFYTVTVYEKGAEVIRMMYNMVGAEGFRKGSDLYFSKFDGCAVTTDDFVACMEQANGVDLTQFKRWYTQSGTPVLKVAQDYDVSTQTITLTFSQSCPPTPGQPNKEPFVLPIKLALVDPNGEIGSEITTQVTEAEQTLKLPAKTQPVVSLLRDFSAPIKLEFEQSNEELAHLVKHDNNGFSRFEALQRLAMNALLPMVKDQTSDESSHTTLKESLEFCLLNPPADKAMMAELFTLPSESYLIEQLGSNVDPMAVCSARENLHKHLATELQPLLLEMYHAHAPAKEFSVDALAMAQRAARNKALSWLCATGELNHLAMAAEQYETATTMTEKLAALTCVVHEQGARAGEMLQDFFQLWQHSALVLDKWFILQATLPSTAVVQKVKTLLESPAFSITNPNKVRSLLGAFTGNVLGFHSEGGYELVAEQIIRLNSINPQVGARLAGAFNNWRVFNEKTQSLMHAQLERISRQPDLTKNISEIVTKALA